METKVSFFRSIFTSGSGVSSKRVYTGLAFISYVVLVFMLYFKKTPIVNDKLFSDGMQFLGYIVGLFFLGVAGEAGLKRLGKSDVVKAEKGISDVINTNVEQQTVNK